MTPFEFVQQNYMLIGLAAVSGGMLVWTTVSDRVSGIPSVGPAEATRLMNDDALMLDVREEKEWTTGHIPRSKHIPLSQLKERAGELEKYKDRPIVINCHSGSRSAHGCRTLKKLGFQQLYNLAGGISAWQQANLPVTRK